jgi:hypothetical protein
MTTLPSDDEPFVMKRLAREPEQLGLNELLPWELDFPGFVEWARGPIVSGAMQ